MNAPPILQRHRSLRWLVPVVVLGAAGFAATGMFRASASSETLPDTTPAALIAAIQTPRVSGFSGTVVSRLSLGLPELPTLGGVGADSSMMSLLSGSHTLQVWYGGVDKQRIALLGSTDETDIFRTGQQVWHWDSADRVAVHTVLPAYSALQDARRKAGRTSRPTLPVPTPSTTQSMTPAGLADNALAALDPTTKVAVEANRQVADRSAYELVLTPRSDTTRVGSVHIAVDGATKIPLGVQIYARGATTAAVDVAYTSIRFAQPSDTYFHFSPPSDAKVHQVNLAKSFAQVHARPRPAAKPSGSASKATTSKHRFSVTGSGWSSVLGYRSGTKVKLDGELAQALTRVSGTWGKGRLLDSTLVSVLVTDDGRMYAGAVDPAALYAAAGAK